MTTAMSKQQLREIFRPQNVHMGKMKVSKEKCTGCGLCVQNCLFRTPQLGIDKKVYFREGGACFSCYNCMIACPKDAITIDSPYRVDDGFWKTLPHQLRPVKPLQPHNAKGQPDEWTEVEKVLYNRRTVRNFSDKPVPEPLIRRVIEAGRAAPSGGNSQPWQFIVITNKDIINRLNEVAYRVITGMYETYISEDGVKQLMKQYEADPAPGGWDPRIILGGMGQSVAARVNPVLLGAPVVILLTADSRAIGGPALQIGICGTNMILTANSLGLAATWVGFVAYAESDLELMKEIGIEPPFSIATSVVLGYPKFRQAGIVARDFRPIKWYRDSKNALEIEEEPIYMEVKVKRGGPKVTNR
jgi:nitroreductase/formate hydrogenlyase subunit 6/NADH:ubiquinone oxidoreductase subunit I